MSGGRLTRCAWRFFKCYAERHHYQMIERAQAETKWLIEQLSMNVHIQRSKRD